jgi:hypothetical protein
MVDIDARGIPTVYVATVEFCDAGEGQARALGMDQAAVFVPHPIQDRSDEEMVAIAEQAFEEIVGKLVEDA